MKRASYQQSWPKLSDHLHQVIEIQVTPFQSTTPWDEEPEWRPPGNEATTSPAKMVLPGERMTCVLSDLVTYTWEMAPPCSAER